MVAMLLVVAVFADFFAPVNPNAPGVAFAPPDRISWNVPDQGWRLTPVAFPITETDELDPVTFQPDRRAGLRQPAADPLLRAGVGVPAPRADPDEPALHRPRRRHAAAHPRHRQARARHLLARHRRVADLARDRALLDRADHARRHADRHHLGLHRRQVRPLVPALRRDHPRLPAAALLPDAGDADPGHRALGPVPDLRRAGHRRPRLGAAVARGAVEDHGDGARSTTCARRWRSAPATGGSSPGTSCPT